MRSKGLAGLLVLGLLLAACGTAATPTPMVTAPTPTSLPPIKLGVIFAATGPRAGVGGPEKDATLWAVQTINEAGGVLGRQIEVVIEDDQGQDVVTGPLAKKLLEQDKVVAIMGSTGLASSRVLLAAAEEAKVPACMTMNWDVMGLKEVPSYAFSPAVNYGETIEGMVQPIIDAGYKKVAMVRNNVSSTVYDAKRTKKLFDAAGVQYTEEEYKIEDVEFSALALRVKGSNPDVIYVMGAVTPPAAAFVKAVRDMGITTPIWTQSFIASPAFAELAGDAAEGVTVVGVMFPPDPNLQSPGQRALVEAISKYKPGTEPSHYHAWAWDCVNLLAGAIKQAGSTDSEAIKNAINSISDFPGADGTLSFSVEKRKGLTAATFYTMIIKNGKQVPK